ncbi:hypothetical protein ACFL1B_02325 [Nanoarchaeota archaeon]
MVSSEYKRLSSVILAITALAALAVFTMGQTTVPTGPDTLTNISTSRYTTLAPKPSNAQAGNVTQLGITAQAASKAWAGFYGNITGTITLESSAGNVFYDWYSAEPEGEIYATTASSITWASIKCLNWTANGGSEPNLTTSETQYGMDENDVDGFDETFNLTSHPLFYAGTYTLDDCQTTYTYVNSAYQSVYFANVVLTDTTNIIFASIFENDDPQIDADVTGFNGLTHDFQLLVAEDGHTEATLASTTYYFWVEIE